MQHGGMQRINMQRNSMQQQQCAPQQHGAVNQLEHCKSVRIRKQDMSRLYESGMGSRKMPAG